MSTAFFSQPGRFFRGNLHTHSNCSDGALDPGEVCRRYKDEGYDFIALTDHFIGMYNYPITDTAAFRDSGFTTLLGAEIHSGATQNGALWHIVAVGLPAGFTPPNAPHFLPVDDQETGPQIARRCAEAGAFVAIAHPHWSGLTPEDTRSIDAAHAVETYNHGCAVGHDRPDGFHMLDLMLNEGRKLNLIATDDAHFAYPGHFGGWVMVKAQANTPEHLLAALKAGHYYSSQGPELRNIHVGDDAVSVECSAAVSVIVQGYGQAAQGVHGTSITRAHVPLAPFANSAWIRVSVVDRAGKRAWSNPIWLS